MVGGAICVYESSNLAISQVNFTQNEAKMWGSAFLVGVSSTAICHTCRFVGNKAGNNESGDAAVAVYWDSSFILTEGMFLQNTGLESSCISSYGGSTMTIDNCTFEENAPTAVLSVDNTFTKITNSKFFNNSSPFWGGAIVCVENCAMLLIYNKFYQNTARDARGGAIFIQYSSTLTALSTTFVENEGKFSGAAIYVSTFSSLSSENCSFQENIAGDETHAGGTIRLEMYSILYLSTATFLSNKGKSTSCVNSYLNCKLFVTNSTFDSNTGSTFGIADNNYLEISGSVLRNNTAPFFGGAIFSSNNCTILVDNATFHKNMAVAGGAISIFNSRMTIADSNFMLNMAETGGGIRMETNTEIELDHCLFSENNATLIGGGLLVNDHNIQNATFTRNIGTSFSSNRCTVFIEDSTFMKNTETALDFRKSAVVIEESKFLSNTSPFGASAVSLRGSTINITHSTFGKNTGGREGAVFIYHSTATFDHCLFSNNNASRNGGGIWATNSFINTFNTNATINYAKSGGFIQILSTVLSMSGCWIGWNTADENGGGLNADESNLVKVINSFFEGNKAVRNGGGMYVEKSKLLIQGTTFKNNEAGEYGAGISATSSSMIEINPSYFLGNNAPNGFGGAMAVYLNTTVYLNEVTFLQNYALAHGALIVQSNSTVHVTNTTVFNNSAWVYAAIGVDSSRMIALSSVFQENNGSEPGCIKIYKSEVYLQNCTLKRNRAKLYGGAIITEQSVLKIAYTTFQDNSAIFGTDLSFNGKSTQFDTFNCLFNHGNKILKSSDDQFLKISLSGNIIFTEESERSKLIHQETQYASSKCLAYLIHMRERDS